MTTTSSTTRSDWVEDAAEHLESAGDPPGSLLAALRSSTERLFPHLA